MTVSARPVGAVDNLWLGMDTPENLMVIDCVMWFDEPLDEDAAITLLKERLVERYPVFRQRPVSTRDPRFHAMWQDLPDFEIHDYIVTARLEEPGKQAQLQTYVERFISQPLPMNRSPWEVHIVHGYQGGTAMYFRFHHALADGTALARVVLELTDDAPSTSTSAKDQQANHDSSSAEPSLASRISHGMAEILLGAGNAGVSMFHRLSRLVDPKQAVDAVHLVTGTGKTTAKLLATNLPETALSGTAGVDKNARWSQQIDLADIRAIANTNDATVNDVLVSALAGALSTYLAEHGHEPTDVTTMVPVNLRPMDRPLPSELGNRFALVLLTLPLSVRDPIERIGETKRRMDAIKTSPEPVLTFGIISTFGALNPNVARTMIDFFSRKAIGVTTNVPGPRTQRLFAGIPVAGAFGWAPGAGNQTLNACIFSLEGKIVVGFKTDRDVIADPDSLIAAFHHEIDELKKSTSRPR